MAKVVKIDRNGTKYWVSNQCPRCGGRGYLYGYEHVEGGVCFKCGGTGFFSHGWKEYTPEYAQKLADRRLAKAKKTAPERNAKFFKANGMSEDGHAWVVIGDTFDRKDTLKEQGARWSPQLGWHFDHEAEGCFCISADDVMHRLADDSYDFIDNVVEVIKAKQAENAPKTASEFIGNVGDKVDLPLTFKKTRWYETHFSYYGETVWIYTFCDANGNTVVWKTSKCVHLEEGLTYEVKGTIKAHNEYKGDNQTELTRCKVIERSM